VSARAAASIALVGAGGLGAPVALALARAGIGRLIVIDDDVVDRTNLHRQVLFRDADVGRPKLEATVEALARISPSTQVEARAGRLRPGSERLIEDADVVVECSDNFATKFLAADLAHLLRKPIVHGAAIRWIGTALAVSGEGTPCYRCLFEDIPAGAQASCDVAGVMGPVCGVVGGLMAGLALSIVDGRARFGALLSLDGRAQSLRSIALSARADCPLCGASPAITAIDPARYAPPDCA
jgi:molybdopterin/thiamine biosynthesis adenylyltransferase